jgi:N-acetyltransferase
VVAVDPDSPVAERKAVTKVLNVVNRELSAVGIDENVLWSRISVGQGGPAFEVQRGSDADDTSREFGTTPRFRAYLYIHDNRCVGLCLAERITSAYEVLEGDPTTKAANSQLTSSTSSSIAVATKQEPSSLGISRIWTSNLWRRQGVASALLECARQNTIYGVSLPKASVAFSQPTASGGCLARTWFGTAAKWKVYFED